MSIFDSCKIDEVIVDPDKESHDRYQSCTINRVRYTKTLIKYENCNFQAEIISTDNPPGADNA